MNIISNRFLITHIQQVISQTCQRMFRDILKQVFCFVFLIDDKVPFISSGVASSRSTDSPSWRRDYRDNRRQSASTWTWLDDVTNLRYRSPCNIRIYLCLEVVVMVKNPGMRLSWSGHAQTPMIKSLLRDRDPGKNAKGMWWQRPELLPWSRAIWSIRSQKCLEGTSLYPGFHLTRGALKQQHCHAETPILW